MSDKTFWGCTPRKLFALLEVHEVYRNNKGLNEEEPHGFIDQIL